MGVFNWGKVSPFEPLGQHMQLVRACVNHVMPMFECVRGGDYDQLKRLTEDVFKAEHEADKVKNRIRETIPKTFALPVYRGDLLAYLHVQDDLADSAENLAVLLTIKKLAMPPQLADDVMAYVRGALDVCDRLYAAAEHLSELAEHDFGGPGAQGVLQRIAEAEHAEWEADKMQYRLAQKLFALEDELRATDILLWSDVFKELGALANHADKTAERLRRMLSR
jgi:hypothetical protein